MSIHPSLGKAGKGTKQRSVLKRAERIRIMLEKDQWKEGDDVYGLPKIKTIKIKVKKEKAEKVEVAAVEGATTPVAAGAETKGQAAGKSSGAKSESAAKGAEKK